MKKYLAMLVSLVMAVGVFTGCSSSSTEASTEASEAHIFFCISHMTNDFTVTAAESMEAAAIAAGAKITVNEGDNDINTQISQIESAITQGASAIIIEPVSTEGVLPAVDKAMEAGIPVVIFNQNISDPSRASCFVGVSNADIGYMEMQRACEDLGGKGNIAVLTGPIGSDGEMGRSEGYERALAEYPDVQIVFSDDGEWTTENGLKFAENWLQTGTEINAFVCQNDSMAMGAVKAVEDKNLQDTIKVYGVDAVADAVQAVADGRLEITVSQATERQAQSSVDAAMQLIAGETVDSEILVEALIIDASNADEYV